MENEQSLKSENEYLFSTGKLRSQFQYSRNSNYFLNSLKSLKPKKGFYEVLARFYLAKKFINNLRKFTSTRSLKYLTEKNLKIINDPIYYPFPKEASWLRKFLSEYYFDPSSIFTLLFSFLNFIIIGFFFVYIPLALCVLSPGDKNNEYLQYIKKSFVLFLIGDVIRRLNTAYYNKGLLVTKKSQILKNYMKRQLLFDFLSLTPLVLTEFSFESNFLDYFLILFYLKLKHFNESIIKFEEVILMHSKLNNILSLLQLVTRVIFLSHIFACLWFYIGKTAIYEETWIKANQLEDQSHAYIFLYSYYFVCVTMNTVGYGDISPTNPLEILFAILFIYVACILFAYTLNSIGIILENINKSQKEYLKEVNIVNNFMREKKINFDLRMRVRKYFEYIWTEEKVHKAKEQSSVLKKLSDSLKEEVQIEAYGHIIRNVKFLSLNFSEESLRKMVPILKEKRYTPGDYIVMDEAQKEDNDLYIITKGSVELFISSGDNGFYTIVKTIEAGGVFGEFAFMTSHPRKRGARSIDFTTIYCINQEEFLQIIKKNKNDYENYCKIRDSILLYDDYSFMHVKCSSCKIEGHLVGKCPLIHYTPPLDIILRRYNHCEVQTRIHNYDRPTLKKRFDAKRDADLIKAAGFLFQKKNIHGFHKYKSRKSFKRKNKHIYSLLDENDENEEFENKILERIPSKTENVVKCLDEKILTVSRSRNLDENHDENVLQTSIFAKKNINSLNANCMMDLLKNLATSSEDKNNTIPDFIFNLDTIKNYNIYFPRNNVDCVLNELNYNHHHKLMKRKSFYTSNKTHDWNEERKKFKTESRANFFRNNFFRNEQILEKFSKEEELDPIHLKNYFKQIYLKRNIFKSIWDYLVSLFSFFIFLKKGKTKSIALTTFKSCKHLKNPK